MKPQERISLINQIAEKLQQNMSLTEIKSYLFAFNIDCKNHKVDYNSKRVFVEEVLSTIDNKIVLNIAKDLGLIKSQNKNFEVVINNVYNRCIDEEDFENLKSFLPFYEDILPEKLAQLFSHFHYSFNSLFEFMNYKMKDYWHYNADESRNLIDLIKNVEKVLKVYENTTTPYSLDKYYVDIISQCNKFLSDSGGSKIPDNFNSITIIEDRPIFNLSTTIKVNKFNFEIKHIGGGSYAEVFKYKDTFYNKNFVIKKAKKDLNEKELGRFKREFQTMKSLNSPYVLEVHKYNEKENSYIMEYSDFTLGDYIAKNNTKITMSQRINIVNQIFKAFEYLHSKNILHRDISISNILLKEYDNILVVKVADFGLVKLKDSEITAEDTELKGSLNDPNLEIEGFKNFSIQHETYALTRLIYFVISGKKTIDKFLNDNYKKFILNGISNNLELRYKSINEMRKNFNTIDFK